jgi:hypothetical protein
MLPSVALAATPKKHHKGPSNCVSAQCVYIESGLGASGAQPLGTLFGPYPLPARIEALLAKYGGKDRRLLEALATQQFPRPVPGAQVGNVSSPGAFFAALDLGAGPTALFAVLLAGAAAFGAARALRGRRVLRF